MMRQALARIGQLIHEIRGEKIILDVDLAHIYGAPTKRLNEQVKRNLKRFPKDFMFQLTQKEKDEVVAICDHLENIKFSSSLPYAFTEHGAIMAANILNSARATQMSVFVVRAFVKMRGILTDTRGLAHKLAVLEKELKGRLNVHESIIVTILQRVMDIIDPPPSPPEPSHRSIGFQHK